MKLTKDFNTDKIPAREQWLFKNKAALKQVRKGLDNPAKGKISRVNRKIKNS